MNGLESFKHCVATYTELCQSQVEAYRELLSRAQPIVEQQRDQDRLRPPHFNIFHALGHAYREVSTHSAMLAHLLDPGGNHGQRDLFLRNFLDVVQTAADRQGKNLRLPRPENASCRTEFPLRNGRIDVLLRSRGLLLVIENKISASDQEEQLERYWRFAQDEAQAKHLLPVIIYLTPDGHPPTDQALGKKDSSSELNERLVLLSYCDDIYLFIQRSIDALAAVSVAEVLRQYAALVRDLT
jgi:hypothetical protein